MHYMISDCFLDLHFLVLHLNITLFIYIYIFTLLEILKDENLALNLPNGLSNQDSEEKHKVKPIFCLIEVLRHLLSSVEKFTEMKTENCIFNTDSLPKMIRLLEKTYEQCEFLRVKKFFSLLFQLKYLVSIFDKIK